MLALKKDTRRNLPLEQRDIYGFTELDVMKLRRIIKGLALTKAVRATLQKKGRLTEKKKRKVKTVVAVLTKEMINVCVTAVPPPAPPRRQLPRSTFEDFDPRILSSRFRFQTVEDLWRLVRQFRLPKTIKARGWKFSDQEVLMISLVRLAFPLRWVDVIAYFPSRSRQECQAAFYWFLDFMVVNWGYLILNNREYWLPHLAASAEAIRVKLTRLPNEAMRVDFNPANHPDGFAIFGFIDNTMVAMCRPGGGPTAGGEQAPRVDPLVQRSWWTGWKKLHGLKWQTVIMANGMDFEVWGPVSVRHNDNFTLNLSQITSKLEALQLNNNLKFGIYGDSAYHNQEYLATGGPRGMSSVRESIEWRYKDLKVYFKYCDYRHCLKLRKQPLAKIVFVSMLLSNAHCTMYGSQTAGYFDFPAPTFEDWTSQGPNAHPIPDDIIFSGNDVNFDGEEDSDDDDEED